MKYLFTPITILFCALFSASLIGCKSNQDNKSVRFDVNGRPFEKISEYAFFKDCNDFSKPNNGVFAYKLVNSMFNDYSLRESFIYLPEGKTFGFDSTNLMSLPVGAALINVVYYPKDGRNMASGKQLIETQLLIKKEAGWEAFDYHWGDDQKDALLSDAGGSKLISYFDKNGQSKQINFIMSSKNECKSCHLLGNRVTPIGINVGNLNLEVTYPSGIQNQLDKWISAGIMKNYSKGAFPKFKNWMDTSVSLDERARSYLSANCAHCHNPNGPAFVSGLFLTADNNNNYTYGICKPPLSKGHGTCNLNYDIVPGKPAESVVVCRLATTEFGVKMPELGRALIDTAGVSLISEWITQLNSGCR